MNVAHNWEALQVWVAPGETWAGKEHESRVTGKAGPALVPELARGVSYLRPGHLAMLLLCGPGLLFTVYWFLNYSAALIPCH